MSLVGGCGVGSVAQLNARDEFEFATSSDLISLSLSLSLFSAVYGAAGYLIDQGEGEKGHLLGLGASLALTAMMGKRFAKTGSVCATT